MLEGNKMKYTQLAKFMDVVSIMMHAVDAYKTSKDSTMQIKLMIHRGISDLLSQLNFSLQECIPCRPTCR